jgi:hypothetical protein
MRETGREEIIGFINVNVGDHELMNSDLRVDDFEC